MREHGDGASLAFSAPLDQLFTATEINEWAVCASLYQHDPVTWESLEATLAAAVPEADPPPVLDEHAALERFASLASSERRPELLALVDEAQRLSEHDRPERSQPGARALRQPRTIGPGDRPGRALLR